MAASAVLAILVLTVNVVLVIQFVEDMPPAAVVFICLYAIFYTTICVRLVRDELIAIGTLVANLLQGKVSLQEFFGESVARPRTHNSTEITTGEIEVGPAPTIGANNQRGGATPLVVQHQSLAGAL